MIANNRNMFMKTPDINYPSLYAKLEQDIYIPHPHDRRCVAKLTNYQHNNFLVSIEAISWHFVLIGGCLILAILQSSFCLSKIQIIVNFIYTFFFNK